jgi:hypothetical protein
MWCPEFSRDSARAGHGVASGDDTARPAGANTAVNGSEAVFAGIAKRAGAVSTVKRSPWPALRTVTLAAMLALGATKADAQASVLVQGVADLEVWKTDAKSVLLSRAAGDVAPLARMHLWSAVELPAGFTLYAMGEGVGGRAAGETEVELEQAGVRWARSRALVADLGLITSPVGAFAGRRLSNRNPLVGAPDAYPVTYPLGAQLSGMTGMLDWRAAMVSLPATHDGYVPEASARVRPALGLGLTPVVGVHVGASWTAGSYLGRDTPAAALGGRAWHDFEQRLFAVDLQASRGYLELWAEGARSAYDVPGTARPVKGVAGYVEARWTFTPRLYAAARAERNDYPFIEPQDNGTLAATTTDLRDVEAGLGFRPAASQLVKLTWRRDSWHVAPAVRPYLPAGYAVALQLSQSFDVTDLLDRARR